jgi:hypothetical protein
MTGLSDPKKAHCFRLIRTRFLAETGTVELVYAFDDGPELIEKIVFPNAPSLSAEREAAFEQALVLLHGIAGVSYYKAGVPQTIRMESGSLTSDTAALLNAVYEHGLAEFAYQNRMSLKGRVFFSANQDDSIAAAKALTLPRRALVPIGGGKDSLVSIELLKQVGEPIVPVWIGQSDLIEQCVQRTGLSGIAIQRDLAPLLFELNKAGAYNGHVPVTAINSMILVVAAIVYGFDSIVFSNERSASSPTLQYENHAINHQWSKSFSFEKLLTQWVHQHVAPNLHYFSLLRPWFELAVTARFAHYTQYHQVFSSCNRNFKILAKQAQTRWCGQCPKCHFVFLALAPFMPKEQLVRIFGRNLLDDATLIPQFEALIEWGAHKPFECVGEAQESRTALFSLIQRAEWCEDKVLHHFAQHIAPQLNPEDYAMEALLVPADEHQLPVHLLSLLHAPVGA